MLVDRYNTNIYLFSKKFLTYALTAGLFQFINLIKVLSEIHFEVSLFHLAP